jgi:hypothetical protein
MEAGKRLSAVTGYAARKRLADPISIRPADLLSGGLTASTLKKGCGFLGKTKIGFPHITYL